MLTARRVACAVRAAGSSRRRRARRGFLSVRRSLPLRRALAIRAGLRPRLAALSRDTHAVIDVLHAGHRVHHILDRMLLPAFDHRSFDHHLALHHLDGDVARVEVGTLVQTLADVIFHTLVGTLPTLRPATLRLAYSALPVAAVLAESLSTAVLALRAIALAALRPVALAAVLRTARAAILRAARAAILRAGTLSALRALSTLPAVALATRIGD